MLGDEKPALVGLHADCTSLRQARSPSIFRILLATLLRICALPTLVSLCLVLFSVLLLHPHRLTGLCVVAWLSAAVGFTLTSPYSMRGATASEKARLQVFILVLWSIVPLVISALAAMLSYTLLSGGFHDS